MSRKPRSSEPGLIYHIIARGNRKAPLFLHPADWQKYLDLLEMTRERFPFNLHAYCLMSNHIHLLLETNESPLGDIFQMLHSKYAIYFNHKYQYTGHLFEGRFKSLPIKDNRQYLDVSAYIHLNPVEAKIVHYAQDYKWSSYRSLIFKQKNPHIFKEQLLSHFPHPKEISYQRYVEKIAWLNANKKANIK
ncbi:transposase [Metabacillus sp. GX 13764]|uniref:transposase n=1 Tax=Metabacillus kandeliae TaxID=2900151 RepID=UPI001E2CFA37|nr:transposase [Metabacillus kandeliae]MCD7035196.1 transposase [Metabacillus kandeliae]